MLRRGSIWAVGAGLMVGTASVAAAASVTIDAPAAVVDRAQRLNPSAEGDLTPEQRAVVELVELVNVERTSRGLPVVWLDPQVTAAAHVHAADMAANRVMQHAGSDGSDGGVRLERAGYTWTSWGENIAAGFVDPRALLDAWMGSPAHRSNILGDFTDVGVGAVATPDGVPYWTLLMATAPYVPGRF